MRRSLWLLGVLVYGLCYTQMASAKDLVPLISATCRIIQREHSGTGFLVQRPARDNMPSPGVALVTAAHVLEQMREGSFRLVLREKLEQATWERREIEVPLAQDGRRLWLRHPQYDVAAMPLTLPKNVTMTVLEWEQLLEETLPDGGDFTVGDEVFMPSFPATTEANPVGWPILRRGSIASYPLRPIQQAPTMILDISSFGGDSGAPVALVTPSGIKITGLTSGSIRQADRVVLPFEERTAFTPLGLSIVIQSPWIRRTIEQLP